MSNAVHTIPTPATDCPTLRVPCACGDKPCTMADYRAALVEMDRLHDERVAAVESRIDAGLAHRRRKARR